MASPEITVELLTATDLRPGDEVAARVRVRSTEPVKCQGIDLAVGCCATGEKCDGFRKLIQEDKGEAIELSSGAVYERTIRARLPREPISYNGHLFTISWFVMVDVRLPWKVDLHETTTFVLLPAVAKAGGAVIRERTESPAVDERSAANPPSLASKKRARRAVKLFLAAVVLQIISALLMLYLGSKHYPEGAEIHGVDAIVGMVAISSQMIALTLFSVLFCYVIYAFVRWVYGN